MIQIPIWLASILVPLIIGIMVYNWRNLHSKIESHIVSHEVEGKRWSDKGGIMFMVPHQDLCDKNREGVIAVLTAEIKSTEKLLCTKIDNLNEKFDLKLDKVILLSQSHGT